MVYYSDTTWDIYCCGQPPGLFLYPLQSAIGNLFRVAPFIRANIFGVLVPPFLALSMGVIAFLEEHQLFYP